MELITPFTPDGKDVSHSPAVIPETNQRRQPPTLLNKASALALSLLALSFIPAQHASAQAAPTFGSATIADQTYTEGTAIPELTLPPPPAAPAR